MKVEEKEAKPKKGVVYAEGYYIECTNPDCQHETVGDEAEPCERCGARVQYSQREPGS